jgi:hypothetical protein
MLEKRQTCASLQLTMQSNPGGQVTPVLHGPLAPPVQLMVQVEPLQPPVHAALGHEPAGGTGSPHAMQLLPAQMFPLLQWLACVQLLRHVVAPQAKGAQVFGAGALQEPPPSQLPSKLATPLLHIAVEQLVPLAYMRQSPEPSHTPSLPQLVAPASSQVTCGSSPSATAPHRPLLRLVY